MYTIVMKQTKTYAQGEYTFSTKAQCQEFLENLNDYEIECIISIEHYTKRGCKSAWYEFFN